MKDKKSILIAVLVFAIAVMSVGYAALAQTLNINGSAEIAGDWDVEIVSITPEITGTAKDDPAATFTPSTATFSAKLMKPGDAIEYTVRVENKGSIDAKLNSISLTPQATTDDSGTGSKAILYEIIAQPAANSVLKPKDTVDVVVKVTYDPNSQAIPAETTRSFTGVIEYVQAD